MGWALQVEGARLWVGLQAEGMEWGRGHRWKGQGPPGDLNLPLGHAESLWQSQGLSNHTSGLPPSVSLQWGLILRPGRGREWIRGTRRKEQDLGRGVFILPWR